MSVQVHECAMHVFPNKNKISTYKRETVTEIEYGILILAVVNAKHNEFYNVYHTNDKIFFKLKK